MNFFILLKYCQQRNILMNAQRNIFIFILVFIFLFYLLNKTRCRVVCVHSFTSKLSLGALGIRCLFFFLLCCGVELFLSLKVYRPRSQLENSVVFNVIGDNLENVNMTFRLIYGRALIYRIYLGTSTSIDKTLENWLDGLHIT